MERRVINAPGDWVDGRRGVTPRRPIAEIDS